MRAAATSDWFRTSSRQSQRVTRRLTSVEVDFHPVPPHRGQADAATFMDPSLFGRCGILDIANLDLILTLRPRTALAQVEKLVSLCRCCGHSRRLVDAKGKTGSKDSEKGSRESRLTLFPMPTRRRRQIRFCRLLRVAGPPHVPRHR